MRLAPRVRGGRGGRDGRRGWLRVIVVALVGGLVTVLLTANAIAQEDAEGSDGEALSGVIEDGDDQPLADVEVVVRDDSGEVGSSTTDSEGAWRVELPGPGTYEVEVVTDTLPEGVELRNPDRNPAQVDVRAGAERIVLFPIGEAVAGAGRFTTIANRAVGGLKIGLIIAITSVGLSLVFGTTGLINFAHGELVTFGAITAWVLNDAGLHIVLAAPIAIAIGGAFGGMLESGFFAKLRDRKVRGFQFLVITIGLALLFQHLLQIWFGSNFKPYLQYVREPDRDFGPISISIRDLVVMALCVVVLVGVATMLQRTRTGKAMRAVADDPDLAESSGIAVRRVTRTVWILAGALAATGGILLGLTSTVQYLMGFQLLLLMFAAVILGGLGTAYGAMVGGLVVGLVSEVSTVWLPIELKTAWALVVLIAVLLVRPSGILGLRERLG